MSQIAPGPSATKPQPEIFVGRRYELDEFGDSIRCVLGSAQPRGKHLLYPHLFLISGEDGVGKSALLRQFRVIAAAVGFPAQRIVTLDLRRQRYPDARVLARALAEAIAGKHPGFDQQYQDNITKRNNLLPTYQNLQHEWAVWQALGELYGNDRNAELHKHYRVARGRIKRSTLLGGSNRSTYRSNRLDWAVDDLRNILDFRTRHGRDPASFDELLQHLLAGSAALFQDDTALGAALSDDIAILTNSEPLLLLIDDYEYADQHDEWLRTALFAAQHERLVVAVAGRYRHEADYRRLFSGPQADLVRFYNLNTRLTSDEMKQYLSSRLGDDAALTDVGTISAGFPLALGALGDQLATYDTIAPYQGAQVAAQTARSLMQAIVQRFLRSAQKERYGDPIQLQRKLRDSRRIRALALMLSPDPTLACELWGVTSHEGRAIAQDLARRYTFIFAGNALYEMHPLIRELVREELLSRTRYTTEWQADLNGLRRVHDTVEARIAQIERSLPNPDDRYHHPDWSAATLDLLNNLLWQGEGDAARRLLLNRWVEARYVHVAFADWLLDQAMELAPQTTEWRTLIQDLQTEDYDLVQSFAHLLDPHMQAILHYMQAQPSRVELVSVANIPRLDQHIALLERSRAADSAWLPASDALREALAARGTFRLYEQNDPAGAKKDFEAVLALRPHDLAALGRCGVAKQHLGDLEGAWDDYNKVLAKNADDGATRLNRALLLVEQKQYQDALRDLDYLHTQYPDDPVLLQRRGETRYRKGLTGPARADLAAALKLCPDDPDLLISLARVHTINKDTAALRVALKALDRAITLQPDNVDALGARGKLKYEHKLADVTDALNDLNKALQLRSDHAEALLARSRIYVHEHDWAPALVDLDQLLALQPDHVAALTYRGIIRYRAHPPDLEGALADLDRSLDLQPDRIVPLDYRGQVKYDLGDLDGASRDFGSILAIDADFFSALYRSGRANYDRGNLIGALAMLDRALQVRPNHPGALICRGQALRAQNHSHAALTDFTQAIQTLVNYKTRHEQASYIEALYWRGRTYYHRGRTLHNPAELQAAWEDFDTIVRLDPNYLDSVCRRGYAADDLGRHQEAVADFDRALKLSPGNSTITYRRGLAKARMRDIGALPDLWATVPGRIVRRIGF